MIRWYLARWEIELFFFDPQPELSTRSTTIVHDSADGAGNGVVSDCELAHWPLDVFGTYGTRFGGQPGVGRGRMAGDLFTGKTDRASAAPHAEHGLAHDRQTRRLSRPRWRARRKKPLARLTANDGLRVRPALRTTNWGWLICVYRDGFIEKESRFLQDIYDT